MVLAVLEKWQPSPATITVVLASLSRLRLEGCAFAHFLYFFISFRTKIFSRAVHKYQFSVEKFFTLFFFFEQKM